MLPVDLIHRLFHLADVLGITRIQRCLNHRLLGATRSTEGPLQALVTAHELIDLDRALSTAQKIDEPVVQLLCWTIFDGFLLDLHMLFDGLKQL